MSAVGGRVWPNCAMVPSSLLFASTFLSPFLHRACQVLLAKIDPHAADLLVDHLGRLLVERIPSLRPEPPST